jgi:hypothetical protein
LPLPQTVPVKISSEAAGYVTITPVVRQELAIAELIANIVGVTGKDAPRVREVLLRGALVSGASRFRWTPIDAAPEEITAAISVFPDPRPDRPFDAARCVRAALTGGRASIELTREAASRKSLLARRSFWQILMDAAGRLPAVYSQYSYSDRADVYHVELPLETARELQAQAGLLRFSSLEAQVREYSFARLELWVER